MNHKTKTDMTLELLQEMHRRAYTMHSTIAEAIGNPDRVWCRTCGHTQAVDAANCLNNGWPECCGETMTIDKPEVKT